MPKNIVKSKAKALEASAATIGDNSISADGKKVLASIAKLGVEANAFEAQKGKKMIEAVKEYITAVKAGFLTEKHAQIVADKYKGETAPKQLVGDFKSFVLPRVIASADYSLVTGATKGKSHFQSMMAINRAIVRATKGKGKDAANPTVNEKFVKAALAYTKGEGEKANPRTAEGKKKLAKAALKRAKDLAGDLSKAVLEGARLNGATKAQLDALASFIKNFS